MQAEQEIFMGKAKLMQEHLIHSNYDKTTVIEVTPESAKWQYLSFSVIHLKAGGSYTHNTAGNESALVPLVGSGTFNVGDQNFEIGRKGVFEELPHILYAPPNTAVTITAHSNFEFAFGSAPAQGKYPLRLFRPDEMKCEIRGDGAAQRQVNHVLAYPLPAERLILFEVYVPGGTWSGWPPHCHDGHGDSAYLEETYYFRIQPEYGFGFHRNYRIDQDFDEVFTFRHTDLVLVTQGFHSTAAAPGSNVYFLNYLAGELLDGERGKPPYDDPAFGWMRNDWIGGQLTLPMVGKTE